MEIIEVRKTLIAGGLAAVALTVAAGAAVAQQAPSRERAAPVSRAEFVDARIARLMTADANRDGSVSREEMQAGREAHRARRADARFAKLDANGDGSISRAEFGAPREARGDRGPHRMRGERGHRGPRAERAGMRRGGERGPVVIADARTRAEQVFARLDSNNDGVVTAEERASARTAMREQRRERMAERRAARTAQQASPQAPASE